MSATIDNVTQDPGDQTNEPKRDRPNLEKPEAGPDDSVIVPPDLEGMPSLAELDAADMATIEQGRTSKDKDHAYFDEDTPPPASLYYARLLWLGAAGAATMGVIYGFLNLGMITDLLKGRLQEGVRDDPTNAAPTDQIDSIAGFFPPAMLITTLLLLAVQYPLLVAIGRRRSRGARNIYVTMALVMLLCIPMGIDLLFDYSDVPGTIRFIGWLQFALLLLSALFTLRRGVNQWLPPSNRMKPTQIFRPGSRYS
ncbi:hypothetical protein [Williamsia sp.]|uniref:hypothetical protein n=1 Tax=Williamsia sp. TaxID=1872085 RepID=UPI002F93E160